MVKSLNHVAVMVTDVDKSRNFYQNVLGLEKFRARRPKCPVSGSASAIANFI
jgi:extradiol dioxygenase family protein